MACHREVDVTIKRQQEGPLTVPTSASRSCCYTLVFASVTIGLKGTQDLSVLFHRVALCISLLLHNILPLFSMYFYNYFTKKD